MKPRIIPDGPADMPERPPVVVVGGGIAGLSAAYDLARRGVPFVLLEASGRWGGVIRTEDVEGFLLEGGPDSILAQKPDGLALARELGLEERIVPTNTHAKTVYVLHEGRLHPLPEGMLLGIPTRIAPLAGSRLLSWPGKLRMALEVLVPRRRAGGEESIAGFLRRRLGAEAVTRLGEPLLAGIHAGDPERLSLPANFPRLADLERTRGSLIRSLGRAAPPSPLPSPFFSFRGGLRELVSALLLHIPEAQRRTGTPVDAVVQDGDGFLVHTAAGGLQASRVIVAVPAPAASRLIAGAAAGAADALRSIRFASTAAVCLGYRRGQVGHPMDGFGLVATRQDGRRVTACTFVSTKFPGRAPEGHVLLRAFVGGIHDPGVLDLDDPGLMALVQRELAPVLGLQGDPPVARVFRWPEATPQMELGHVALVARVAGALPAGLFVTGSGLRGTGIPDTIADARATAAAASA